jgi:hypothetical protein
MTIGCDGCDGCTNVGGQQYPGGQTSCAAAIKGRHNSKVMGSTVLKIIFILGS